MKQKLTQAELKKLRWEDLSSSQRAAFATVAVAEIALAIAAWVNLARRPREQVRGPKPLWAAIIAINGIGPIAYFVGGRRRKQAE